MQRSGHADLPLHGGHVPAWLSQRMTALGTAITESILLQYGRSEFLSRLSDPFWFQALGSVMGMDWHSSGITTSVMGALKRGLNPKSGELGIYVCGGRGQALAKHAGRTARCGGPARSGWRSAGAPQPAHGAGGQQRHRRRLSDLPAQLRGDARRGMGGRPAGHEPGEPDGAALSLALAPRCAVLPRLPTPRLSASRKGRF